MEPEFKTKIGDCDITFWYNSKTHKYKVIVETAYLEPWINDMSKAKAETIIDFLKILNTQVELES